MSQHVNVMSDKEAIVKKFHNTFGKASLPDDTLRY